MIPSVRKVLLFILHRSTEVLRGLTTFTIVVVVVKGPAGAERHEVVNVKPLLFVRVPANLFSALAGLALVVNKSLL
jgi:hypothetical protein